LREHDLGVKEVAVCSHAQISFYICLCTDEISGSIANESFLFSWHQNDEIKSPKEIGGERWENKNDDFVFGQQS
jgi:hypothetical protein